MIPKYFSMIWTAAAPAVANHLWQSTVFAIIAGLLTLAFRKNHARIRFGLWLAASLKFLVPFSLLVEIGSYLAWPGRGLRSVSAAGLYFAMQEVARTFAFEVRGPSAGPYRQTADLHKAQVCATQYIHLLPAMLIALWLCGFAAVLVLWYTRWRRASGACEGATPLQEGREVEALRRVERMAGIRKPIQLLLSPATLEPAIFGIIRPVLVWPEGISKHLEDAQLQTIIAHEVWHVRRRDNLAATMHMIVEAIFWFHPLVWWMGWRLVEERERACDEEVVQLGNERRVYAEGILKACEFCVESPTACVSGVTGSDLKKRIVRIMSLSVARKLDFRGKMLLGVAGFLAIAVPIGFGAAHGRPGQANAPQSQTSQAEKVVGPLPKFEVASIKPNHSARPRVRLMFSPGRFIATGVPTRMLIYSAYHLTSDSQLMGGPKWIDSEKFDIEAKEPDSFVQSMRKLPFGEVQHEARLMLQSLLADRFKLNVTRETKELPVYALVVAKNGPKLTKSALPPIGPIRAKPPGPGKFRGMRIERGGLSATGAPMSLLADVLSRMPEIGRVVLDDTGLKGRYDFTLKWTPEFERGQMLGGPGPGPGAGAGESGQATAGMPSARDSSASSGPSIFTAIQQQLGLKLKPEKGPVEVLVIDHIEPPTPN